MSAWSNEETMAFLEAYQSEALLWNPKERNHKDKKKCADAWSRLSQLLNKPVKDLKAKKETLMATFRKHFKKKQDSVRSGAGTEDIYQPCWFAFELMESFLMPVYTCNSTLNTETQSQRNIDEIDSEPGDGEMDNNNETLNTPRPKPTSTHIQSRRHRPAPDPAEQQMATAFGQLTNVLGRRSERPTQVEEDQCDLYGKLLAKKLRELSKYERQMLMYEIDGLFINRLRSNPDYRETSSPQHSYSSNPNVHPPRSIQSSVFEPYATVPRPSSTQTSFSEPYTNVPSPKRSFPTDTRHSVPLHVKITPKYRSTSSVPLPPPQNTEESSRETPSPQYFYSPNSNVRPPRPIQPSFFEPYATVPRPSSTQTSFSEPYTNVPSPKRSFPTDTRHSVPLHVKITPKYRSTSSVPLPPPQNTEESSRETPSPQYFYSPNSNVRPPRPIQPSFFEPYATVPRPSSTQTSFSEPYTNVPSPKRSFPTDTRHSVPLHVKITPKYRSTSSVPLPPPQNTEDSSRETPSPQYFYSPNSNVRPPRPIQPSFFEPYATVPRPSSTQTSFSEQYTNVPSPKRSFPTDTLHSVPLHAKIATKYRSTSSVPPSPPQNTEESSRETPSPQYSYSSNPNVHPPRYTQSPYLTVPRPPSTQTSYSEPYTNVPSPKGLFPTDNLQSVPSHAKIAKKYRRTSFVAPKPPQNNEENDDSISYAIIHRPPEDYSNSSNIQNSNINVTSDQIIVRSSDTNIITEALMSALSENYGVEGT